MRLLLPRCQRPKPDSLPQNSGQKGLKRRSKTPFPDAFSCFCVHEGVPEFQQFELIWRVFCDEMTPLTAESEG